MGEIDINQVTVAEIHRLLDEGKKIEAIKLYRRETQAGLKESKDAVEAIERGELGGSSSTERETEHPQIHDALEQEVMELLRKNQRIQAIRRYRDATGVSLREAHRTVSALASDRPGTEEDDYEGASAPISPGQPITDMLIFTDHAEAGKRLYLPRYRLATRRVGERQEFDVQVTDDPSSGGSLSVRLLTYPAAGIEEAVRDTGASHLPHVPVPVISYRRTQGRNQVEFDEKEMLEDGLRATLHLAENGEWHELKTALRAPDREALLVVSRKASVAIRQERAADLTEYKQEIGDLTAQQRTQERRLQQARSRLADLRAREQELEEKLRQLDRPRPAERTKEANRDRPRVRVIARRGRKSNELAKGRKTLSYLSAQIEMAGTKMRKAQQALMHTRERLNEVKQASKAAARRPAYTNQDVDDDHVVSPDPFVVIDGLSTEPDTGGMASVRINGHLYHWDPASPHVVLDLPDRFVLARDKEPPHFPVMRLRFDTVGASDAQDVRIELEYSAEPVYSEVRREKALDRLWQVTGADEVRFEPYPAKKPTLELTLPFDDGEGPSAINNTLVNLETGIQAALRMSMNDFQTVYAALFGASTVFMRGEVYVKTGSVEPEEIPLALRVEDLEPDQVYDAILDETTATTLTRSVTVQAFFEPLADLPGVEVRQITVNFRGAPDATLTPDDPIREIDVPRSIRSVVLSNVDPSASEEVDNYQFKLTFVLTQDGETRFIPDKEWREDSGDTLMPEMWLDEVLM